MTEDDALTISPEAALWVVDQLVLGRTPQAVATELADRGVPVGLATAEVAALAASPATTVAKAYAERARRLELAVRNRAEHGRFEPLVDEVDGTPSPHRLLRALTTARPLAMRGFAAGWPSASWTWEGLRERFGHGTVEVCDGRDCHARPDARYAKTAVRMRFDAFLDRVTAPGESNDVYLLAHNRAFQEPLLDPLRADLRFPEVEGAQRRLNLWLGPRGTRTPLHHDRVDILFVQILGRKRFHLADGLDLRLLFDCQPFWVDHDLASPPDGVSVHELDLEPGDALLLPCGTWHQVRALDPALSISTTTLGTPNHFHWYEPGGSTGGPPPKATQA